MHTWVHERTGAGGALVQYVVAGRDELEFDVNDQR